MCILTILGASSNMATPQCGVTHGSKHCYHFTGKRHANKETSEMKEQIWSNMKLNCALTDTIVPAVNLTGRGLLVLLPTRTGKGLTHIAMTLSTNLTLRK